MGLRSCSLGAARCSAASQYLTHGRFTDAARVDAATDPALVSRLRCQYAKHLAEPQAIEYWQGSRLVREA
jgi:hypothetical protein